VVGDLSQHIGDLTSPFWSHKYSRNYITRLHLRFMFIKQSSKSLYNNNTFDTDAEGFTRNASD